MISPKNQLKKLGEFPKKRLGQNFLVNSNILERLVDIAEISDNDLVVEIGAGLGGLTSFLAQRAKRVLALEIDQRFFKNLKELANEHKNLEVIHADVLKFDFLKIAGDNKNIKVVGNIPYNISTPLVFKLLKIREHISLAVLMFQKEVGIRITAHPNNKDYGLLSIFTQLYCEPSIEMTISSSNFYPIPKVDSVVVKFLFLKSPRVYLKDEKLFEDVVKTAFSKRRKNIKNCLRGFAELSDRDVIDILESVGIDPNRRGESMSIDEFGRLANEIFGNNLAK